MTLRSRLIAIALIFTLSIFAVGTHATAQDAKPEPATAVADHVDAAKPKLVPIKSEADMYHLQAITSDFTLNAKAIEDLNRAQEGLRNEATPLIKKMAADAGVSLEDYQPYPPLKPTQFILTASLPK